MPNKNSLVLDQNLLVSLWKVIKGLLVVYCFQSLGLGGKNIPGSVYFYNEAVLFKIIITVWRMGVDLLKLLLIHHLKTSVGICQACSELAFMPWLQVRAWKPPVNFMFSLYWKCAETRWLFKYAKSFLFPVKIYKHLWKQCSATFETLS